MPNESHLTGLEKELLESLEEVVHYTNDLLTGPIVTAAKQLGLDIQWHSGSGPQDAVMRRARAVIAQARAPGAAENRRV